MKGVSYDLVATVVEAAIAGQSTACMVTTSARRLRVRDVIQKHWGPKVERVIAVGNATRMEMVGGGSILIESIKDSA